FVTAFVLFPLRESNRPLFESIMPVVLAAGAVILATRYLTRTTERLIPSSVMIGCVWFVMSIGLDLLLLTWGPMRMSLAAYMADIGITYLIFPIITVGMGRVLESRMQREAVDSVVPKVAVH